MADDNVQLPPGYEDAKPVQPKLQLPPGYEDAKPVAANTVYAGEKEGMITPPPAAQPPNYEVREVLPSGERVGSMQRRADEAPGTVGEQQAVSEREKQYPILTAIGKGIGKANETAGKMSEAGAEFMKPIVQAPVTAYTAIKHAPETLGYALTPKMGPAPNMAPPEEVAAQEHPVAMGVTGAVGSMVGGMVADPRQWPLLFLGGETVSPLIQKAISAGFAANMGKDTIEGAKQLGEHWDSLTPEERAEQITQLGLSDIFAGMAGAHTLGGEAGARAGYNKVRDIVSPVPETLEVKTLAKETAKAEAAYDKAKAAMDVYRHSVAQGINPPQNILKAYDKAATQLAEAKFHEESAREAAQKATADRAAANRPAIKPQPPTKEPGMLKTPAPKPVAPAVEPEITPLGKLGEKTNTPPTVPVEHRAITIPPEPTEAPKPSYGRIALANDQGTMGTPRQLTEGTPEGPKIPEGGLPKIKIPEEKPVEVPKPVTATAAEMRALKPEAGKVVDKEETPEGRVYKLLQEALKPGAKVTSETAPKDSYTGEERREKPRPALMSPTEIEEAMKNRKPVHTPFDVTEGAMETIKRDQAMPKHPAEEATNKPVLPKEEPTGYIAKKEEVVPAGEEGRTPAKSAEEYHPSVEQKINELSDENLRKLARAHGLNPDEYDFNARDERRHRVERDQLAKDIAAQIGEDEKINLGRAAESVEKQGTFKGADVSAKGRAERAAKMFPRLRGPVDEFGNPTVAGGAPTTEEEEKLAEHVGKTSAKDTDHVQTAMKELGPNAKLSDIMRRAQELKDQAKSVDLKKVAAEHNKAENLGDIKAEKVEKDPRGEEIARAYEEMEHNPEDPEVKKSYSALIDDAKKQWKALEKAGVKIEPVNEDPYKSYEEMHDDLVKNKRIKVYRGGNELPKDHPLAKVDPETGETYNVMFRAIHDAFGHAMHGNDFSEKGEENAWNAHRQMMSKEAVPAMTTETKGQTSWFFNNGEEPGKFAEQKAGLLPDFVNEPTPSSKDVLDHIKSGKDYAVLTAENPNNERASAAENAKNNRKLLNDLKEKGYEVSPVEGHTKDVEGNKEHSFFVKGITPKDAAELGRKYGQAAVLTTEGLHDLKEDVVTPSDNKKILTGDEAKKQPYYSTVSGEPFSVPLDFNRAAEPGKAPLHTVSGGAPETDTAKTKKLPTGDELIKKYGESSGDPAHTTFILPDGRGVANTGVEHDRMLGGTPTDKVPPRERFVEQGNIRVRPRSGGKGGREVALSIPESGINTKQLDYIKKMGPQLRSGAVLIEVGKPGGDYKVIPYGEASDEKLESSLRELAPIKNEKGAPVDEFGNPTVSGGSQSAGETRAKAPKETPETLKEKLPELAQKHLTEEEKEGITTTATGKPRTAGTVKFLKNMEAIPEVQEYKDIALQGEGARKWYSRSSAAFDAMVKHAPDYFKNGDKEKFIGVLAATSPQQSVAMNLREALSFWKEWNDAGRPEFSEDKWNEFTDLADKAWEEDGSPRAKGLAKGASQHWEYAPKGDEWKAENLLIKNLSLPSTKVPNVIKALRGENMWPDITKNKAFKAPSFTENLKKWLDGKSTGTKHVTNDSWMGLFGGIDKSALSKPENYHPLSVATRAAAEELGWEPEEAQAAIWSFTQALTEKGVEDPELIRHYSEDFRDLLEYDNETRDTLEALGVNLDDLDRDLAKVEPKPEVSGRSTPTTAHSIARLRGRIEEARGKGAIPEPKSVQGNLFRENPSYEHKTKPGGGHLTQPKDEAVRFNPEEFSNEESGLEKLGEKKKKSPYGSIK